MMSAFIGMFNDLPPEAKRRLLLGWLPILLVTILLCVFGGLPPTSWGLAIRLLALLNALKTVQSSSGSDFLNILLIQAVCTFIAWLLVILAIVSEVIALKAMQTQLRIRRLQARLASSAGNVLAVTSAAPPQPKNYGAQVNMPDSLDAYPTSPLVSLTADAKSQGVQSSSNWQGQPDPFTMQKEVLNSLGNADGSSSRSNEPSAQQQESVSESVFVYGNPFEGELPEIFTYDKDLQKAVESLRNGAASKQSPDDCKGVARGKRDQNELNKDAE
jgi:hypothetical protein